jgi:hypothetical protein
LKQIRKRLTYANVMSSIAVFLILGGATAIAAKTALPKKSVGVKQLKNNAVTTAKVKKAAITSDKLKDGAVNGAKVQDGSLTGSDLNLSTLGTVPNATNAVNATNAAKAAKAAQTEQIANIFFAANEGEPKKAILNLGGLTISATCPGGGEENEIEATTAVSHSVIDVVTAQDSDYSDNIDFNVGETFDVDESHSQGDTEMYTLQYTRPDGINVVVNLHDIDSEDGPAFPGTPQQRDCLVAGIATTN